MQSEHNMMLAVEMFIHMQSVQIEHTRSVEMYNAKKLFLATGLKLCRAGVFVSLLLRVIDVTAITKKLLTIFDLINISNSSDLY